MFMRTHRNVTLYVHCTSCVLPNCTVVGRCTIKAADPIVETMNKSTYKQIIELLINYRVSGLIN
jgi:hypothetical protein